SSPRWYFLATWQLVQLLGHHEWSLRLPSILAGTALIPLTYLLALQLGATRLMALAAAALMAMDRHQIHYSLEARLYAIAELLAILQVMLFWAMVQRRGFWLRLGWILLSAGLFHLHYTTVFLPVAEVAFLALMAAL